MTEAGHWETVAGTWSRIGPPLRPAAEDLTFVRDAVAALATGGRVALVLGVTPELHRLPWPDDMRVVAVDREPAMVAAVWPGRPHAAALGDWTRLPLADRSCGVAVCDGGLHLLSPTGQHRCALELRRVLVDDGLLVLRLFVPPAQRETVADIGRDLHAGRIRDLNIAKFRLWMALEHGPDRSVALRRVWETMEALVPDRDDLVARIGWDPEHLGAIDSYRGSAERYSFLTLGDARRLFCDRVGGFVVEEVREPAYELGSQCPTVVLRRRPGGA